MRASWPQHRWSPQQSWASDPKVMHRLPRLLSGHGWATCGPQMGHKAKRHPRGWRLPIRKLLFLIEKLWLRGQDLNLRPLGYEPNEVPGCSTPRLSLCM